MLSPSRIRVCLACFGLSASAVFADPHAYLLTKIKTPAGFSDVTVADMNNHDALVGSATPNSEPNGSTALYWSDPSSPKVMSAGAAAYGINDPADACGAVGPEQAVYWDHHITLKGLPMPQSVGRCRDLNGAGTKVGEASFGSTMRAVRWDDDGIHNLGSLGDARTISSASAISPSGIIVGSSNLGPDNQTTTTHAVSWPVTGSMVDLGTLGGPDSAARAVNDAGQIVGRSNLNIIILGSYVYRATLWEAGVPQDLGTADGQYNSDAYGINESGLVVGTSYTNNPGHATLWDHGSNIDLDALLSPQLPANYRLTKALRINNKGNILLAGLDASGNPVFYLATAVSPTHVTLASTVNPSLSGDPVLLVATVTADSGGTPTTAVTFEDGSSVLGTGILDSSGRATLRVFLGVGTHPLTASFKGYVPYGSSTSAVYTQRVRLKLIPTPH